jgi:hypothetical protein
LGGLLLGSVLILLSLPEPPSALARAQASQAYKLATGAVLLCFLGFQWLLALARSRHWLQASKSLYALHQSFGLIGPPLLYLHASRWGFGYLGVLMGALFANHVLGLMRSAGMGLPRWAFPAWTVVHVALSVVLVALAGYHGWQVFYRE